MTKRIIVDPITRIEGHLRIEVEVDSNNVVKDAWSSITLWRGIETILKGRDPRVRTHITKPAFWPAKTLSALSRRPMPESLATSLMRRSICMTI